MYAIHRLPFNFLLRSSAWQFRTFVGVGGVGAVVRTALVVTAILMALLPAVRLPLGSPIWLPQPAPRATDASAERAVRNVAGNCGSSDPISRHSAASSSSTLVSGRTSALVSFIDLARLSREFGRVSTDDQSLSLQALRGAVRVLEPIPEMMLACPRADIFRWVLICL
jgi:hypothetical protein